MHDYAALGTYRSTDAKEESSENDCMCKTIHVGLHSGVLILSREVQIVTTFHTITQILGTNRSIGTEKGSSESDYMCTSTPLEYLHEKEYTEESTPCACIHVNEHAI